MKFFSHLKFLLRGKQIQQTTAGAGDSQSLVLSVAPASGITSPTEPIVDPKRRPKPAKVKN